MVKRIKVGLKYNPNEGWIAGSYYIINLIHGLNTLSDTDKPIVVIFCQGRSLFIELKKITGYPYLQYKHIYANHFFLGRVINKASRFFFSKNIIERSYSSKVCDLIFPNPTERDFSKNTKKVFWIPDFQEKYYPQFFHPKEIEDWSHFRLQIAMTDGYLVLSSKNVLEDFSTFYPNAKVRTYVMPFAVKHPPYQHLEIDQLLTKYNLPKNYFFCPNQFWAHKNQTVVIRAVEKMQSKGIPVTVAFSGKMFDYRNPNYTNELLAKVESLKLENSIKFLGFIDRTEQLQLMNNAEAIIQPSLFEGWSTVVEDAKAMSQKIIVSKIAVHEEQLSGWSGQHLFFDPHSAEELESRMSEIPRVERRISDYNQELIDFGQRSQSIFCQIINS